MTAVEVLQVTDNIGNLHYYEVTPLQKRILVELPVLSEEDVYWELERVTGLLLDEPKHKQEVIMKQLPFTPTLTKKLNVNLSTLKTALDRKKGYRKSLMEMGIIGKITIGQEVNRPPTNYYYKTCEEEFVIRDIQDKTSMNREYETPGYNNWRNEVLNRDGVCQCCGLDKHLQVHHLFGYKEHPELATVEENGVTLCKFCHDKYHSIYGLKNINPLDFMEFMDRFKVE